MAEDWDKLAEEYAGHPVALIGEVDCTSDEGHPVCEDFEVQVCYDNVTNFYAEDKAFWT